MVLTAPSVQNLATPKRIAFIPKDLQRGGGRRSNFRGTVLISGTTSDKLTKRSRFFRLNDEWGKSWNGQHLLLKKFA